MAKTTTNNKNIFVFADWQDLAGARLMGMLKVEAIRGKEVFSFSYEPEWLETGPALLMDPSSG